MNMTGQKRKKLFLPGFFVRYARRATAVLARAAMLRDERGIALIVAVIIKMVNF